MKRIHLLLAILAAVACWAWLGKRSDWPPTYEKKPAGVRGRCVDQEGTPLRGCAVTLGKDDAGGEPLATTTGRDGTFEFATGSLGLFLTVVARADGRAPARAGLRNPDAGVETVPDLVLYPGFPLRGRVVDGDLRPRIGVEINFRRAPDEWPWRDNLRRATTDAEGGFAVPELVQAGWWLVQIPGESVHPAAVHVAHGAPVELIASGREVDATITGQIVDDQGEPLPAARYLARSWTESSFGQEPVAVDAEGSFTIEHLAVEPRRPLTLTAECPGYERGRIDSVPWGSRDVRLVLRRQLPARVRVVDGTGAPVPDVPVGIGVDPWDDPDDDARTGADGVAALAAVPRGRHRITVGSFGWALARIVEIEVQDGATVEAVVEVGEPERRSVVVRRATGDPLGEAELELCLVSEGDPRDLADLATRFERGEQVDTQTTSARGEAVIRGHPSALHVLRITAPARRPIYRAFRIGTSEPPFAVDVDAGAGLRGILRPLPALSALAELAGEAQTAIELRQEDGERERSTEAVVGEDGSFTVADLEPGDWTLRLQHRVLGRVVRTEPLAVLEGIRAGEQRDVTIDITGLAPVSVAGTVTVNGAPHFGEVVFAVERGGADGVPHTIHHPGQTDAEGRFRRRLPPGRWRVLAAVANPEGCWSWLQSGMVDVGPDHGTPIDCRIEAVTVEVSTRKADGTLVDALWQFAGSEPRARPARIGTAKWSVLLAPGTYPVGVLRSELLNLARLMDWLDARMAEGKRGAGQMDTDVPAGDLVVPSSQPRITLDLVLPEAAGY